LAAVATTGESTDDLRLMEAVARRDPNAMRALYDRHSPLVFSVCFRVLGNRADAEELLGDIFWEVWEKSGRFDAGRGSPITYLVLLARSRAIDRKRSRVSRPTVSLATDDAPVVDPNPTPAAGALVAEQRGIVVRALAELEPQQRQAIECAFYDGLSHSEIADKLKKPLGTVKTWIRQGLIRMRDLLRTGD
jgi:RNA polymerase sigma-70 factor (ECF subfamily)